MEWSEEQEASARSKVEENSSQLLPQHKQGTFGQCPYVSLGFVPGLEQSGQVLIRTSLVPPFPLSQSLRRH